MEREAMMEYRDGAHHCILVLGEGQDDGILIQAEGGAYAYRSALIPHARDIVNSHIRQLADYAVFEGTEHTEDGKWTISYDELHEHFGANITDTNGNGKLLKEALQQRAEINELIMTEDCIEITYHMEYCQSCQKGGLTGAMSLLSLLGCNLYDVHPVCMDSDAECDPIDKLTSDTLTAEGKQAWADVLGAEVRRIYPGGHYTKIELANCDASRLSAFTRMLSGQCDAEDYERWVRKSGVSYAPSGAEPDHSLAARYSADLVATYEELLSIPQEQRITDYFGDYGIHHFRYGVTEEQIRPVYDKALAAMEMTEEAFRANPSAFLYRGEIIGRMRDCLLANELQTGEEVLFVATEPYGGPGDFCLRGGIVLGVDEEQKTCKVRGDFFTMDAVPLHYVLGRYNEGITEKHYGREYVEPLFGEHPSQAQHYLQEAEEAWNQKWEPEQAQEEGFGISM